MNAEKSFSGVAIRCGLVSGLILVGGMLAGLLAGFAVNGLPMHVPEQTKNLLSALPVLAIITAAGRLQLEQVRKIIRDCHPGINIKLPGKNHCLTLTSLNTLG